MLVEIIGNKAIIRCECGKIIEDEYPVDCADWMKAGIREAYNAVRCEACIKADEARESERLRLLSEKELLETLDSRMKKTGIPEKFRSLEAPYVRHASEWLFRHRQDHLILGGDTGTGKTSSIGLVVRCMLKKERFDVMYRTRCTLFSEHIASMKGDSDSENAFLNRLEWYDIIIIDELVGKRGNGKLSPAGQDLLHNLLDGAYSGARKAKIWLFGNLREGSFRSLFDDPEPAVRRVNEVFTRAWVDKEKVIENINI